MIMFSRQATISTVGLLALVAASAWLAVTSTVFESQSTSKRLTTGIGHDMTNWSMGKDGKLASHVTATKLIHYANNNSTLFNVVGTYYNLKKPLSPPWHLSGKRGYVVGGKDTLTLKKDVVIQRFAQGNFKPIRMDTQKLIYLKDENVAKTDAFVKFTEPTTGDVTTAVGMHANFNTNKVKLLKHVHTTYLPPKPVKKEGVK